MVPCFILPLKNEMKNLLFTSVFIIFLGKSKRTRKNVMLKKNYLPEIFLDHINCILLIKSKLIIFCDQNFWNLFIKKYVTKFSFLCFVSFCAVVGFQKSNDTKNVYSIYRMLINHSVWRNSKVFLRKIWNLCTHNNLS